MSERESTYPWLRLLETELQLDPKPTKRKRAGRPRNPFPRKRVRTSLTASEQAALDELVEILSDRLGRALHRGHVIAFMTFRLRQKLQREHDIVVPEEVDSFIALARYLEGGSPNP